MTTPRRATTTLAPIDCWYAAADSADVSRHLLAVRALERPIVLWRTAAGTAVALEDRCAHRAYPLSAGVLSGDDVQCGLCGFRYDPKGQCVAVPSQPHVPSGAQVTAYPVHESDGVVWVWCGEPGRAPLHRVPQLPWLTHDDFTTIGGEAEVAAGYLLLHENFADVTQVPFVAPELAPSVLGTPTPLDVVVTETTVSLHREFPSAPLPQWQAELVSDGSSLFTTKQDAHFLSPAAWVDYWDVTSSTGATARMRFTQLVTPITAGRSRVLWRVSRDFAVDSASADARVSELFADYYSRVFRAMEIAQATLDSDGPGPEINVSADIAALKVRDIVLAMLAEESPAQARP